MCIIGAGPAGLSMLSALHNPDGALNDGQEKWRRHHLNQSKADSAKEQRKKLSICVVDPAGGWLSAWNGRFAALGIKMLRSPAWATPDFYTKAGIREYAWKTHREAELTEVTLPKMVAE